MQRAESPRSRTPPHHGPGGTRTTRSITGSNDATLAAIGAIMAYLRAVFQRYSRSIRLLRRAAARALARRYSLRPQSSLDGARPHAVVNSKLWRHVRSRCRDTLCQCEAARAYHRGAKRSSLAGPAAPVETRFVKRGVRGGVSPPCSATERQKYTWGACRPRGGARLSNYESD